MGILSVHKITNRLSILNKHSILPILTISKTAKGQNPGQKVTKDIKHADDTTKDRNDGSDSNNRASNDEEGVVELLKIDTDGLIRG